MKAWPVLSPEEIVDVPQTWPVRRRKLLGDAKVFRFVTDTIVAPDGSELRRSYVQHPGAVVVLAVDEHDRVVVVRQYRHPVGLRLLEPPAGLLDIEGEDPLAAAKRELAEEVQLAADRWDVLGDFCASPGSTQEGTRIYLARGLRPTAPPDGYEADGEEADMGIALVPFDDLLAACREGRLHNVNLMLGVLLLAVGRLSDCDECRPADAPWPTRATKEAIDHALD